MPYALPTNFNEQYDKASSEGVEGQNDSEFQRVEPGTYLAVCVDPRRKTINDKQVLEPAWEIIADVEGRPTEEMKKRTSQNPFYLTNRAMWRFTNFLKCMNIFCSDRQVWYDNTIVGRYAAVEVSEETYTRKDGTMGSKTIVTQIVPPIDKSFNEEKRDGSDPKWENHGPENIVPF